MVGFCTNNQHLVAYMELCITICNSDFAIVLNTRAYEVAIQEVVNLQDSLTLQILVGNLHMHLIGLLIRLRALYSLQLFFLFFEFNIAYIPY